MSHNNSSSKVDNLNLVNLTLAAIEFEENEARNKSQEHDIGQFTQACNDLRLKLNELKKVKEVDKNFGNLKEDICMLFLDLKKLNRLDKIRCKFAKDQVNEMRQKVDSYHLQLQNLMYEVLHLQKEINKCHEFKSKDELIDLADLNQFYSEAPSEISRPKETKKDAHKCRLARLEWELHLRKKLAMSLEKKNKLKENYLKKIQEENLRLESIKPILLSLVEAAQPLNKHFKLPFPSTENESSSAEYLSRPLYVLYVNALAGKEAKQTNFSIEINGNVEDAKAIQFNHSVDDEDTADSENEDTRKNKRHRKSKSDKKELFKKIIAAHPLSVSLNMTSEDLNVTLSVEFFYMTTLKIVTVKVKISGKTDIKYSEILNEHILNNLFPEDDGNTSPNPANAYHLQSIRVENFSELTPKIGLAYKWAQTLAGLHFLDLDLNKSDNTHNFILNFSRLLNIIESRFNSRVILHQQIVELEKGMIILPPTLASSSFNKLICILKDWSHSTLEEWRLNPTGKKLFEAEMIGENNVFYKASLERGSAHLLALVSIPCNYPLKTPIFQLVLNWKSTKTSEIDNSLRDLEEYVNVKCIEMISEEEKFCTLSYQVHCLCVAFDTLLEAEQSTLSTQGPLEFQKGRIFWRVNTGRDHSKPFTYSSEYQLFR